MTKINNKSKIYIAGHNGMVGSSIWRTLKINGFQNLIGESSSNLDLRNQNEVEEFICEVKPDLIIHAAGTVGGILFNLNNNLLSILDNNLIGINLVKASIDNSVKNFINISSSCVYPSNINRPIKESDLLSNSLEKTNEGYAMAKINTMKICEYADKYLENYNYKTLIPCNLYGIKDNFNPKTAHLIPGVLSRVHHAKKSKISKINIWGDGTARREFMYVDDVSNFIMFSIKNNLKKIPTYINIGYGEDFSILEYYKKIAKIVDYRGNFVFDLTKPVGMKRKLVDSSIANSLGWKAETNINDGLKITYNYFLKHTNEKA